MKQSKLTGLDFIDCKDTCGKCAANTYKLPYRLGVALFNLEASPNSKHTMASIQKQFSSISCQEITILHNAVKKPNCKI
jgi:hypothetical protein